MPDKIRVVNRGKDAGTVQTEDGQTLKPPADWALLPPGDAAYTRAVKKAGPSWQIRYKKGRRFFSGGVWAPEVTITQTGKDLEQKRSTPEYAKKRDYDLKRRAKKQETYIGSFHQETLAFLRFHPKYAEISEKLAAAVTEHATPVGSGTVARTERIPLEERVKAAVIAWMRHHTTAYDHMKIQRVKGKRREVRRALAAVSSAILKQYREGEVSEIETCPLYYAINNIDKK